MKQKYYENEFPHDEDLPFPLMKWDKSSWGHNIAIFGKIFCSDDNIHLSINYLKERIKCHTAGSMDTHSERDALNLLSCEQCIQNCTKRTCTCIYSETLKISVPLKLFISQIHTCVKTHLEPCEPFGSYDKEKEKVYIITTEYYFDCAANNKKTAEFEMEGTKGSVINKSLNKWPNSTLISCEERS